MTSREVRTVAVVNDSEEFIDAVAAILSSLGLFVEAHYAPDTTIDSLVRSWPDAILVDARLVPDDPIGGWDLARSLRADPRLAGVPVILCTGDHAFARSKREEVANARGFYLLTKPFAVADLEALMQRAVLDGVEPSPV